MDLKKQIALKGYTQSSFAEKIGVSESAVSRWIKGDRLPRKENIKVIHKVLNIPINDILSL